jgi:replicative DNA helicase
MKLSAPVYRLKRRAKLLSRQESIPHHTALDRIATGEGFGNWSLLAARTSAAGPARTLLQRLRPGDLLLVAARPGHGKTLLSLELAVEAMKTGRRGVFFTLEYTEGHMLDRFRAIGAEPQDFDGLFAFENSDAICADYIVASLETASEGTVAVVDYLQLLDQKRQNPELDIQVRKLKSFARERGLILVFISQVDRSYDPSKKPVPDMDDIRLPNPLDLGLFDKACFLNDGEVRFQALS